MADLKWRKSSFSTSPNGTCVECAGAGDAIAVRDSKDPEGGQLRFAQADFEAFIAAIR